MTSPRAPVPPCFKVELCTSQFNTRWPSEICRNVVSCYVMSSYWVPLERAFLGWHLLDMLLTACWVISIVSMTWSTCARLALPDGWFHSFTHAKLTSKCYWILSPPVAKPKTSNNSILTAKASLKCSVQHITEDTSLFPAITSHSSPPFPSFPLHWTHCDTVQRLRSVFPHLPLMASDAPQFPGSCSHPANTPWTNGKIS